MENKELIMRERDSWLISIMHFITTSKMIDIMQHILHINIHITFASPLVNSSSFLKTG